VLCY